MTQNDIETVKRICYNVIKRSGLVLFIVAVIAGSLLVNYTETITAIPVNAKNEYMPTVILDAGHGGFDGGAVAEDGTAEKDINLAIALQTEQFLNLYGYKVILTRHEDCSTDTVTGSIALRKKSDLQNRLALMSEFPDAIYVSIHLNKFTTSAASGAQVFYAPKVSESEALAKSLQNCISELLQPENTRVIKPGGENAFLLDCATVPAVIAECGFISNHRELLLLKDPDYQSKMAFAVAMGIINYYEGSD